MSARRAPLWRWEPAPFIFFFLVVIVASSFNAGSSGVLWVIASCFAAAVLAVVWGARISATRPRHLDSAGSLRTPTDLRMIDVAASTAEPVLVSDVRRHQNAIDAAAAFGGDDVRAALIPNSTRWLGRRLRVGVHLVSGERAYHSGFLPASAESQWLNVLNPLARAGAFVAVPALVIGVRRPFAVEVDLGGIRHAVDAAGRRDASGTWLQD